MPHVAFLLHPRALLTGLTIPSEMLRAADELDRVRNRRRSRLRTTVATIGNASFEALGALCVTPQRPLEDLTRVDLMFVPPFWRRPVFDGAGAGALLERLEREGSQICAISTGSFLVAEAGLLDGKVATTHWQFLDTFADRYPRVQLKRHHLITRAGGLFCAGSLNATADLTTLFIENWYGPEVARHVESQFSPEIRRPARQLGFFDDELNQQPDELMALAQDWLREHASITPRIPELAAHLGLSQRSLNRRFLEATGKTPGRYLQQIRIDDANRLLRNSNLSIAEIASQVGYADPGNFSTLYRRLTNQSPSSYRSSVRAKLFSAE